MDGRGLRVLRSTEPPCAGLLQEVEGRGEQGREVTTTECGTVGAGCDGCNHRSS